MKRFLSITIAILLLISTFSACKTKQESRTILKEVFPLQTGGVEITPEREISADTKLPATLPVYENKYPVTHGGPQYEFDDAGKEELEQAMNSFLEVLYREAELPLPEGGFSLSEPEEGKELAYNNRRAFETDRFSVFGWPPNFMRTKVSLELSDPLISSMEAGRTELLLENFAVHAALEYAGIDAEKMELQSFGQKSPEYKIIEASDSIADTIYRAKFQYVRIELLHDDDWADLMVDACCETPEKLEDVNSFSQEQVIEFVRQSNPDLNLASATCNLYFDELVEPGKYRPCYKVETANAQSVYIAPVLAEELESSATDYDLESSAS